MMNRAEREHSHEASLRRIETMQLVSGRGDRSRIDHEGTLMERARLTMEEFEAHRATERGLEALDRLLHIAQEAPAGEAGAIFSLLAAVRDHQPLSLDLLRGPPPAVVEDMLAVIDAYRWARLPLVEQVEGGARRVAKVLARRG